MFSLSEIVQALTGQLLIDKNRFFSEAVVDSRQVISGSMFVAVVGENADGHDYIGEAFRRGALVAIVEIETSGKFETVDFRSTPEPLMIPQVFPKDPFCIRVDDSVQALQKIAAFHRSQLDLKVIGITGTVGKSTTKELITEVLSQQFHTLKNSGNLNNEIGLPLTLLRAGKGHQVAVLEMGFYVPGEIKLLCDIAKPEIGVITNVGTVHAERAGSIEVIAEGKSELVQALPESGVAILNYDDEWVRPMAAKTRAKVFYYGLNPKADLWADQIESYGLDGIRFCFHYRKESFFVKIPLIGRHSVHTALRAAAVGKALGLSWEDIFAGLNQGQSQLRMAVMLSPEGAMIIDVTYNASPESVLAALNLLQEMDGYKLAILGEMRELGQYEENGHILVGTRAAEVCDELIGVGEKTKNMVASALQSGMKPEKVKWFLTVAEALSFAKSRGFRQGEVVLIKGSRGLQMEQIVDAMETKS